MTNCLHRLEPGRVLVIGHRGAEALAPENTWPSLERGYEAGADVLEVDVQLTRDGEAILFHDFSLYPKFGDPRWIRGLTWAEVSDLNLGGCFGAALAGERIPRLADVLKWAHGRIPLQLDLKHGFAEPDGDQLERTTIELLDRAGMAERVLISSWDEVALARIHARRPDIALAVNLRPRVADPVARVAGLGARWVVVYWPQTDREAVERLHAAGYLVCLSDLFTGDYTEVRRLGVDAVTAGDPAAARAGLEEVCTR